MQVRVETTKDVTVYHSVSRAYIQDGFYCVEFLEDQEKNLHRYGMRHMIRAEEILDDD